MSGRCRPAWLWVTLLMCATGCATGMSSRDPFAGTRSGGRNRQAVRVGLEVVCNQCLITFSAGAERGSTRPVQDDQVWSHRFVRYPIGQEMIQVCANASEGRLERVRIFVNGDLAAAEENDARDARAMICASTLISVPPDAGELRASDGAAEAKG